MKPLISQRTLRDLLPEATSSEIVNIFHIIEEARAHEFDLPEGGYQVGDVVEWCGRDGVVEAVNDKYTPWVIKCSFGNKVVDRFTNRGAPDTTFPRGLKFISRPLKCKKHEPKVFTDASKHGSIANRFETVCQHCNKNIEAVEWKTVDEE